MLLNLDTDLREYQKQSIHDLRAGFKDGHKKQVLCAPTGGGKTRIASALMQESLKKGTKIAFMVDRVSLVDQTSAALDEFRIPHGVIQAGHWRRRSSENLQICSAQTVERRGFFPDLGLLIVDECHAIRKAIAQLIKSRPELNVIGLSATPFTKGIGELYSNLVNVTTTNDLVAQGVLAPLKIYAAKAIDVTGMKVIGGEWSEKEIEERGNKIVGDIVAEWQGKTAQHFGGPVKTIVFSATVDHGAELCKQFNAAGYNFQQISYKDGSDERRRELIEEFRKPDSVITGLVSCEVFTKGFDVPDILCGIAARPYRKSLSSHIQQMGRVMRSSPGKEFGLWLDHCGNIIRFKDDVDAIFENGPEALNDCQLDDKVRKEPTEKEREQIKCSCGYVFLQAMTVCPSCGKERVRHSQVEVVAGEMVLVEGGGGGKPFLRDKGYVWAQVSSLGLQRRNGDLQAAYKYAIGSYKTLYGIWPKGRDLDTKGIEPTPEVVKLLQHHHIRRAKGRASA